MREDVLVCIRRQETAHADAVDPARRVAWWNADDDRSFALARQMVPDRRRGDRSRAGDLQAVVRVIGPVAKTVDAERAGVLAGRHAHPGGNGDRWDHALQASIGPGVHQPPDIRQILVAEEKLGSSTVEPQYQDLHDKSDSPSIAGPLGTPRAARIDGARSSSRAPSPRNGLFMNKTPGTLIRIDNVIAAPLFDVVFELRFGDAPHRRRPRNAVSGGEINQQGQGLPRRRHRDRPPHAAARAEWRSGRRAQGRPSRLKPCAIAALTEPASSEGTIPCASRPFRFK